MPRPLLPRTFSLEPSASNFPASNRPAPQPPPGRQVPGSERSKAPIRRHDEPTSFLKPPAPTRAPPRSESLGACRPSASNARLPRTFLPRTIQPRTIPFQPPSGRQTPGSERSKAPIRRHDEPTSVLKPPAPTRAPPRSESLGACRPSAANALAPRILQPRTIQPSTLVPPRTNRPFFKLHAPSHTAAPVHSSRRTAASPAAGSPRTHPPP